MQQGVRIRPEEPADIAAVHAMHCAAFDGDAEARIVDALRHSGRLALSLVAEAHGEVVGQIAFSPVSPHGGLALAPLAVAPASQNRGIGTRLVREGLDAARSAGAGFVVVIGEPSYYGRFGFQPARTWNLSDEFGAGPVFQGLELVTDAMPRDVLVHYASEFAEI